MNFEQDYKSKFVTADEAVKVVKSGDIVHYGEFVMNSHVLDAALAKRKDELKAVQVKTVTCPPASTPCAAWSSMPGCCSAPARRWSSTGCGRSRLRMAGTRSTANFGAGI